jgi:hypothetical protein
MGTLLFEIRKGAGDWVTLGAMAPGEPEGSVTDVTGGGRDILLFRCDGARSVVSRLAGAIDFDIGPGTRVVMLPDGGREILAELAAGQSYERDVISDARREYRARWSHRN